MKLLRRVSLVSVCLFVAHAASAQPGGTAPGPDAPPPDGFMLVPQLGLSGEWFSQAPGDEGNQYAFGPTIGIFLGARRHGYTFGITFDHTEVVEVNEDGYGTEQINRRIERVHGQVGYTYQHGRHAVTPMVALGVLDSDVPNTGGELVGVSGRISLAYDSALSPTAMVGVNFAVDLGAGRTNDDSTITTAGGTVTFRLAVQL